ncbi:hypothetical protein B0H21DRAFT_694148, partial [Amylocystis lapponica]
HRCLQVTEILWNIFEHALHYRHPTWCHVCVLSLALTCRAFHQVGIGILWREQHGLVPLIKCMPDDAWQVVEREHPELDDVVETFLDIARPPLPQDWERFEANAKHVKVFIWDDGIMPRVNAETLRKLSLYRPRTLFLLPDLRALYWRERRRDVHEYVNLFLAPKLTVVHIGTFLSHDDTLAIASSLGDRCPLLKALIFTESPEKDVNDLPPVQSRSICALQYVHDVYLPFPILVDAIIHLATRPALATAHIVTSTEDEDELCARLSTIGAPLFPVVRSLGLRFSILGSSTVPFFSFVKSPNLESVGLASTEHPSASILRKHLKELSQHPCAPKLTSLQLHLTPLSQGSPEPSDTEDDPDGRIDLHVLTPLLSMRSLQFLNITSFNLDLDNAALVTLSSAMPALRTLELTRMHFVGAVPRITLAVLVPLFRNCPRLSTLRLALDARLTPLLPPALPAGLNRTQLMLFSVEDSPIRETDAVAAFLSMFCQAGITPYIVCGMQEGGEHAVERAAYRELWGKVQVLLPLFVRVRGQALRPEAGMGAGSQIPRAMHSAIGRPYGDVPS